MQRHARLDTGLRVKLGRVGDLEQHVFHDVAAIAALELERPAPEQHVVVAPGPRAERRRVAHLARHRDQREAHRAARRVAGSPALARARVRRVPVGAQRAAVDPGMRQRVQDLFAVPAQHACHDRRRCDPDEQHVVEADPVVAVLEREHALDLVRLDHRLEHVTHRQRRPARRPGLPAQIIRHREDAAEIVGRVAPLGREPGVVEVEPAVHGADVERRHDRVQLVRGPGHARAAGQRRAGHDRAEQLGTGRVIERLEPAGERVHQAVMRGLERKITVDLGVAYVVGDIGDFPVPVGTLRRANIDVGHG